MSKANLVVHPGMDRIPLMATPTGTPLPFPDNVVYYTPTQIEIEVADVADVFLLQDAPTSYATAPGWRFARNSFGDSGLTHILPFSFLRNYHRLACAEMDVEIRVSLWVSYG